MNMIDLAHRLLAPGLKKYEYNLSTGQELFFYAKTHQEADKRFNDYMTENCTHPKFENGLCVDCDFKCDHQEIEDHGCLDCVETVRGFDDDYLYDQWKERGL